MKLLVLWIFIAAPAFGFAGEGHINNNSTNEVSYGSKLEFIVERYVLDDAAREEYKRVHPPRYTLADLNAKLLALKHSARQYHDWVKAVDEITRQLFAKVPQSHAAVIDTAFAPLEQAINDNLDVVSKLMEQYGASIPAPAVAPEVLVAWHQLLRNLTALHLGEDPATLGQNIKGVIMNLRGGGVALTQLLNNAQAAVEQLGPGQQIIEACRSLLKSIEGAAGQPAKLEHVVQRTAEENAPFANKARHAVDSLQETGGDLLERRYSVYQDLSDPFLAYVADHPELWKTLPNHGSVTGDGDTQFIIVFENQLDGRFNFVSVDPTKVIQARMRIGRQVAQSMVSLAGVATKAFGVPIPGTIASDQSDKNSETIDFSKMTGLQTQMKKSNEIEGKNMESLRAFAITALSNLPNDPGKADDVRKDLIRRLQPYLMQ